MKIVITILFVIFLAACAHKKPYTIMDAKNECIQYGFKPDTPRFSKCVMIKMEREKRLPPRHKLKHRPGRHWR